MIIMLYTNGKHNYNNIIIENHKGNLEICIRFITTTIIYHKNIEQ